MANHPLFFRPSIPQICILATCLAFFTFLVAGYYQAQDDAARRLALRNQPPTTVSITDFVAARDTGLAREVSVTAQIDPDFAMRRTMLLDGRARHVLVVPLLAPQMVEAIDPTMIFGYAVIPLRRSESDGQALRRTLPQTLAEGAIGRVVRIDGQRMTSAPLSSGISDAVMGWGRVTSRTTAMIQPFGMPRAEAFSRAPKGGYRQVFLWLTIALAMASAVLLRARTEMDAARRFMGVSAHRSSHARKPNGHKALARFAPLKEQERLNRGSRDLATDGADLRTWLRRAMGRSVS